MTEPTEFVKARAHLRTKAMALIEELSADPILNTQRISLGWRMSEDQGSRNEYSVMVELEVKEADDRNYWVELVDEDVQQ